MNIKSLNKQFTVTDIQGEPAKPRIQKHLDELALRLPSEKPAAPSYAESQETEPKGKESHEEINSDGPKRLNLPPKSESTKTQSSPSTSLHVGSRSSIGSIGSIRYCHHNSASQRSLPHSTISEKIYPLGLPQGSPKIGYVQERCDPCRAAAVERGEHVAASLPMNIEYGSQESQPDLLSLEAKARLDKWGRESMRRKCVFWSSIVVASLALMAMFVILSFHKSKKMARAGFTGSTTTVFFCVGAALWAKDRTMVEAFIAMNITIVYGIFLNGQIDVFLYNTSA
jgi:hypothetical protein